MLSQDNQSPSPIGERSLSFSLGTALAWLGHDCPGACPREATGRLAAVWFSHLPETLGKHAVLTLVEVDFGAAPWSALHGRALLRRINACVRPDRISVRERAGLSLTGLLETGLQTS
jgi:hypothetical protein